MADELLMCGEVHTRMWRPWLELRLRWAGIRTKVKDLGTVLEFHLGPKVEFDLEWVARGEYLARAGAETLQQLLDATTYVSEFFSRLKIKHRFETYEGEKLHYQHYDWPLSVQAGN